MHKRLPAAELRPTDDVPVTPSGPSANRSARCATYISAKGVHFETPVAPCIWIASSTILHARIGTIAFTALTHTRASSLPSSSIAFAAVRTILRIDSISMRAVAIVPVFRPRWRSVVRSPAGKRAPLHHQLQGSLRSTHRTHAVMDPPGCQAELGNLEPRPLAQQDVAVGNTHAREPDVHVTVRRIVVAEHIHRTDALDTRGVHGHEKPRLAETGPARRHHHEHNLAGWIAGPGA